LLQHLDEDAVERRVFEATFEGFGEGRSDGEGDDNVVGVFGGAASNVSTASPGIGTGSSHMALSPLVDGESWLTMDLRRSVIFAVGCEVRLMVWRSDSQR
jgi:hypothetical protein